MITHTRIFENEWGNCGNQLFQYASLLGLAKKYHCELFLPKWNFSSHFSFTPQIASVQPDKFLTEPGFHYSEDFFDQYSKNFQQEIVDVKGWLQSEKYWLQNKKEIRTALSFKDNIIEQIKTRYGNLFEKTTIAISIRRGDFVDNPNYAQIPIQYYYLALFDHFPDWRTANIFIFSDDIPYCKNHFGHLENCFFVEHLAPLDQLVLGSLCDHFIISNSTFSWWIAYLGEKAHSKVIHPAYHFSGPLLSLNAKDYYPEQWIKFDHIDKKIPLNDVSIIIPVSFDHYDRQQNLELSVCLLQRYFDVHIVVGEQGGTSFSFMAEYCEYVSFNYQHFHRTKMLNQMTKSVATPIVINYDADVLIAPLQIFEAVETIRNKQNFFVFPYDGRFANVPRRWFGTIARYLDIGVFRDTVFNGARQHDMRSVGGAIAYSKQHFLECGGENEKFISYAPEDRERAWRFDYLGYEVKRISGPLFHMDHYRGHNSGEKHFFWRNNLYEFEKELVMSVDDLREYITTWENFDD